jgi:dTMP kinase
MALLVSASRSQLVSEVIRPALRSGRTVVTDRYAESTLAYQCFGFGLERRAVEDLTLIATGGLRPDRIVYVDVPAQVGLQRLAKRGAANRLDQAGIDFQARVRAGYVKLISEEPERWISVDGTCPEAAVHDQIMGALRPLLEKADVDR